MSPKTYIEVQNEYFARIFDGVANSCTYEITEISKTVNMLKTRLAQLDVLDTATSETLLKLENKFSPPVFVQRTLSQKLYDSASRLSHNDITLKFVDGVTNCGKTELAKSKWDAHFLYKNKQYQDTDFRGSKELAETFPEELKVDVLQQRSVMPMVIHLMNLLENMKIMTTECFGSAKKEVMYMERMYSSFALYMEMKNKDELTPQEVFNFEQERKDIGVYNFAPKCKTFVCMNAFDFPTSLEEHHFLNAEREMLKKFYSDGTTVISRRTCFEDTYQNC